MDGLLSFACVLVALVPTDCKVTGERKLPMVGMTEVFILDDQGVELLPGARRLWNRLNSPDQTHIGPITTPYKFDDSIFPYLSGDIDPSNMRKF